MNTDVIHAPGDHPDWSESFYFNFYDSTNDICAFMRVGLKPNKNEKNVFCFILMPDGSIFGVKDDEPMKDSGLKAGGVQFEKIVAEKKWRLNFSGKMTKFSSDKKEQEDVRFSVDFETLNDVFDYRECVSGRNEEISKKIASEHMEQFGRASGNLSVGDKEFQIDGLGERDHSWGVRDWNAPKMWLWLTCQFSDTSAFNVTKLILKDGEVDAGFIHVDGKNVPILKVDIHTDFDEVGNPKSLQMKLVGGDGVTREVTANVIRQAVLPFASEDGKELSLMHETLARYELGDEVGYGIAEYLIRMF